MRGNVRPPTTSLEAQGVLQTYLGTQNLGIQTRASQLPYLQHTGTGHKWWYFLLAPWQVEYYLSCHLGWRVGTGVIISFISFLRKHTIVKFNENEFLGKLGIYFQDSFSQLCVCVGTQKGQKRTSDPPEAGVVGSCKQPSMDTRNQTPSQEQLLTSKPLLPTLLILQPFSTVHHVVVTPCHC